MFETSQFVASNVQKTQCLNSKIVVFQRVNSKKVDEDIFYQLVQYFAVVLFECHEAEDFSPAKNLMNMCFTFFYEGKKTS